MIRILFLTGLFFTFFLSHAQEERSHIRKGNEYYNEGKLEEASNEYNEALGIKGDLQEGIFNLGNIAFQNKDYETAAKQFETAAMMAKDKTTQAEAYHNMGNALMEAKKYDKGLEAYKNALRLNSKDSDTRYNLAYALEMLRQNPEQQQQDQDKENDEDKDKKDKDKKDDQQKKDEENKDNKDQEKKDQEKKDGDEKEDKGEQGKNEKGDKEQEEQQPPQPKEGQLSKEEAERLLEALQQEEQKVQEKLANKKIKAERRVIEKDW